MTTIVGIHIQLLPLLLLLGMVTHHEIFLFFYTYVRPTSSIGVVRIVCRR